jgi:hypothetical protein
MSHYRKKQSYNSEGQAKTSSNATMAEDGFLYCPTCSTIVEVFQAKMTGKWWCRCKGGCKNQGSSTGKLCGPYTPNPDAVLAEQEIQNQNAYSGCKWKDTPTPGNYRNPQFITADTLVRKNGQNPDSRSAQSQQLRIPTFNIPLKKPDVPPLLVPPKKRVEVEPDMQVPCKKEMADGIVNSFTYLTDKVLSMHQEMRKRFKGLEDKVGTTQVVISNDDHDWLVNKTDNIMDDVIQVNEWLHKKVRPMLEVLSLTVKSLPPEVTEVIGSLEDYELCMENANRTILNVNNVLRAQRPHADEPPNQEQNQQLVMDDDLQEAQSQ